VTRRARSWLLTLLLLGIVVAGFAWTVPLD
jgi:hypothetical protein